MLSSETTEETEFNKRILNLEKVYKEIINIPLESMSDAITDKLLSRPLHLDDISILGLLEGPIEKYLSLGDSSNDQTFLRSVLQKTVIINMKDLEEVFTATCFEEIKFATDEEEKYYLSISYGLRKILDL
jgi:hypothetical protein